MKDCKAEFCPMWGGDNCLCEVFDLDPDNPPRSGTFSVIVPNSDTEHW